MTVFFIKLPLNLNTDSSKKRSVVGFCYCYSSRRCQGCWVLAIPAPRVGVVPAAMTTSALRPSSCFSVTEPQSSSATITLGFWQFSPSTSCPWDSFWMLQGTSGSGMKPFSWMFSPSCLRTRGWQSLNMNVLGWQVLQMAIPVKPLPLPNSRTVLRVTE